MERKFSNKKEIIKQLDAIAKQKEGKRTPRWIYDALANLPFAWRITKYLPPPPQSAAPYHVICSDPLIIIIPEDVYEYPKQWKPFFDALKDKKVYFLCRIRYKVEDDNVLQIMQYYYYCLTVRSHEKFSFIFLANTKKEHELLRQNKLYSIFCNQNCFVDEKLYIIRKTEKKYDAVYNARPIPKKNFHLASRIPNLALITYFTSPAEKQFFEALKKQLPNASCLNFGEKKLADCLLTDYRYISPENLSRELCKAHCGLCLSDREGANYASIEYLLSGLPVVSVPSIGGRDVFFDPGYCFIAEKTQEAVRDAVMQAKALRISPQEIREATIQKMNEHRNRFLLLIQRILDENNKNIAAQEIFEQSFINRMYKSQPIQTLRELI